MHLIPWVLLKRALIFHGDEARPDTQVVLSNRLLRMLIEAALAAQPFEDSAYLRANPDVARSVREGNCASARKHYATLGYYEDRSAGKTGFDEDWYLERYPDIKRAVAVGDCRSGYEHFSGAGVREWRSPNKEAEPDIYRWHQAVAERAPARRSGARGKSPAMASVVGQAET
jgi:hypothetical protein